jgi:hypothetical protein
MWSFREHRGQRRNPSFLAGGCRRVCLEENDNLAVPDGWKAVTTTPTVEGSESTLTLTVSNQILPLAQVRRRLTGLLAERPEQDFEWLVCR